MIDWERTFVVFGVAKDDRIPKKQKLNEAIAAYKKSVKIYLSLVGSTLELTDYAFKLADVLDLLIEDKHDEKRAERELTTVAWSLLVVLTASVLRRMDVLAVESKDSISDIDGKSRDIHDQIQPIRNALHNNLKLLLDALSPDRLKTHSLLVKYLNEALVKFGPLVNISYPNLEEL